MHQLPLPEIPHIEPWESQVPRQTFTAYIMGRRVTITVALNGSLWRQLTVEEIRREGLSSSPGPYCVAEPNEAASWMKYHTRWSDELEEIVLRYYCGVFVNYWQWLVDWRKRHVPDPEFA